MPQNYTNITKLIDTKKDFSLIENYFAPLRIENKRKQCYLSFRFKYCCKCIVQS